MTTHTYLWSAYGKSWESVDRILCILASPGPHLVTAYIYALYVEMAVVARVVHMDEDVRVVAQKAFAAGARELAAPRWRGRVFSHVHFIWYARVVWCVLCTYHIPPGSVVALSCSCYMSGVNEYPGRPLDFVETMPSERPPTSKCAVRWRQVFEHFIRWHHRGVDSGWPAFLPWFVIVGMLTIA